MGGGAGGRGLHLVYPAHIPILDGELYTCLIYNSLSFALVNMQEDKIAVQRLNNI